MYYFYLFSAEAGECQEEKSCKSHWAKDDQNACSKDDSTP